MNSEIQNSKFNSKNCPSPLANASGAVLLTVVVIIIIIGLAGVAIYSFTSTSTFTQLISQNATKAYFMAESGFRVVASEYNNAPDPKNDILESLHGTSLSLAGNTGQFDVRVYPYWFYVSSVYTANTANINVKIPGGAPLINPPDIGSSRITYPNSGELKLHGKTQLATITSVSPSSPADGATITFGINPGFPFDIQTDEEIFLVYSDNTTTTQAVSQNSSIDLPGANPVARILPAQNGSFRVYNEDNDNMDYTYLERTPTVVDPGNPPTTITLTGIQHQDDGDPSVFPFTVDNTSEIYFGRNLAVFSTSTVGTGAMAAKKTVGNYTDVGLDGGFFKDKDTISFEEDIDDFTPTMNDPGELGDPDPIEINTTDGTIGLGGGLPEGYGSVWYTGDSDIANCIAGNCQLGRGFRAYFEFEFDDTDNSVDSTQFGEGFTFSLVSSANYTNGDTGLEGQYMGYAGPAPSGSGLGLQPPKLAVEIDTYPNPGAGDVCDGTGDDSRRDDKPVANHAALVYWGEETIGSLSAQGGYLRIGSATPANDDPEDWSSSQGTISFWFKRDTIFYGNGSSSGDRLWGQDVNMETRFNSTGANFFLDWGSGGNAESAINAVNPFTGVDPWYFIAITWDDTTDQLHVYWGDESSISLLAENLAWTGDMSAIGLIAENLFLNSSGGDGSKNYAVDGKGSDLRYYDVVRDLIDIQSDYDERLSGSEAGLQAYFPLQADLADAGVSAITATTVGTTDWSADTISDFDCVPGAASYDDNRHGSGGSTTPRNSLNINPGNGNDGYHQVTRVPPNPNWLEDSAWHSLRMELIRPLALAEDGKVDTVFDYQIKVWIDCDGCSAAEEAGFQDVRAPFTAFSPQVEMTVQNNNSLELPQVVHDYLMRFRFGFTQGTGMATQDITLGNLELFFLKEYPVADLATW
jgi:hypothetical protein